MNLWRTLQVSVVHPTTSVVPISSVANTVKEWWLMFVVRPNPRIKLKEATTRRTENQLAWQNRTLSDLQSVPPSNSLCVVGLASITVRMSRRSLYTSFCSCALYSFSLNLVTANDFCCSVVPSVYEQAFWAFRSCGSSCRGRRIIWFAGFATLGFCTVPQRMLS